MNQLVDEFLVTCVLNSESFERNFFFHRWWSPLVVINQLSKSTSTTKFALARCQIRTTSGSWILDPNAKKKTLPNIDSMFFSTLLEMTNIQMEFECNRLICQNSSIACITPHNISLFSVSFMISFLVMTYCFMVYINLPGHWAEMFEYLNI